MTTNDTYDWQDMSDTMRRAYDAIRRTDEALRRRWHLTDDREEMAALSAKRDARYWIIREFDKYPVHQVINAAIKLARPRDWHQLLLEHPHESQGDRSKIAYTQNEIKGQRDIQTVTSVGKYLTRHFDLPDHTIRDLVSRYGSAARFQFVHTTAEMIYHLHRGPASCMVWSNDRGIKCRDGVTRHPYEAYDPKYGWHMAVRIEGDNTMGRALCMTSPQDGVKYFVRSYLRPSNESTYSQTDDGMDTWLKEQGYTKENYWRDDERLAYHEANDHFLAPFLDGGEKNVTIDAGAKALVIDSDGEYTCDQTGGYPTYDEEDENGFECEDCGDNTDEDDGYWIGRGEDTRVCRHCVENSYVYAYGRRGNQYYVHQDNAVYVESNSEHYDEDYLSDNEIVELENGDYEQMEEAIEINGDWYTIDDERICRFEDTDEYGLTEDGWQCEQSCNWYTDDCTDWVEINDVRYHKDYAPSKDDAEDEPDATPQGKPLTMAMLNECSLIEERRDDGYVMFSISLLHNGRRLITRRLISQTTINQTGWDAVREHCRKDISADLIILSNASSPYVLEAT